MFDIRPLVRTDAAVWRRLRLEALKTHPTAFLTSYEEAKVRTVADFADSLPGPESRSVTLGLFVDGALQGVAALVVATRAKEAHKASMAGVYLRPALRGAGAADALVAAVIALARERRIEMLAVSVTLGNAAARKLYIRHGFVPYGVEPRALRHDGVYYDEELMVLSMCRDA